MSEYTIETRRRSRSKTPFLRSSCDHELCEHAGDDEHIHHHHQHHKKKAAAPNVQTIVEEVIEVTSSSPNKQQQYESKQVERIKTKTSDYSSEDTSPENKYKRTVQSTTPSVAVNLSTKQSAGKITSSSSSSTNTATTTTTTTTFVTKSKRSALGGATTSTPKGNQHLAESFAEQFAGGVDGGGIGGIGNSSSTTESRRFTEITQNALNSRREHETSHGSNRSKRSSTNSSLSRLFGDSFDMATADLSSHLPYIEYKETGEYWNKTPKTDYTYSELSPHRRILAPGIVAMPNMSRHSLENYSSRAHFMQNYEHNEMTQRRYASSNKYAANRRETEKLLYDSGDELDYNRFESYRKNHHYYNGNQLQTQQNLSWFMRIITTIVTTITTLTGGGGDGGAGGAGGVGGGTHDAFTGEAYITKRHFYTTTQNTAAQRGFFGTIGHGISSAVAGIFRYISLAISSILSLDTWLLQSSNADSKGKKRFLLLLLLLLPLLLLAGLFYTLHPNESFPPKSFTEYTFTLPQLPSLPELPQIDLSDYVNEQQFETLKKQTYQRLSDFRDWTDDYVLYLRTVSQNIVDEGRKLFQRDEHFERV